VRKLLPLLALPFVSGCVYAPLDLGLGELGEPYEARLTDGSEDEKVLLLRIDGEITGQPDEGVVGSSPSATSRVRLALDLARRDEAVRAVVLRIDSPGGGVTASDVIHHELVRFRRETDKPIVAWFGDTAASGGYYVAMAADEVVASPTCVTGSIGVVALFPHLHGLGEKIGVDVEALTSGPLKDAGSPFRPMRPEERALLQGLIDSMHARFVDVVARGRADAGLDRDDVLALADGRVYTAEQARDARLVDAVGYLDDAVDAAARAAGLEAPLLVAYERRSFGAEPSTIYSGAQAHAAVRLAGEGSAALEVVRTVVPRRGPVLKYLWSPGGGR